MNRSVAASRVEPIVESRLFHRGVIVLIFLNAIIVGLETYPNVRAGYGQLLDVADRTILYLFTLELVLRFFAADRPREFFKSGWNMFDLFIVAASFLPASEFFTVARLFRVLRRPTGGQRAAGPTKARGRLAAQPALSLPHQLFAGLADLRLRSDWHFVFRGDYRPSISVRCTVAC